jgi:hypothetical protein
MTSKSWWDMPSAVTSVWNPHNHNILLGTYCNNNYIIYNIIDNISFLTTSFQQLVIEYF